MKKTAKRNNVVWYQKYKLYLVVAVCGVIAALVLFLGRGWIRHTFEPAAISVSVGHGPSRAVDSQLSALDNPFDTLGISSTQRSDICNLTYAKGFSSEVVCTSTVNGFAKIPSNLQPGLAQRSKSLEALLKSNGWTKGNTSISELGANIANGIDYTPDAAYTKKVGKVECLLDFNTAFSKPKPAAIAGSLNCQQAFELFGGAPILPQAQSGPFGN